MTTGGRKGWVGQLAWCLYDWANSAFPTVITTFVFAAYFTQAVADDPETGTALWGQAMAVAGLLIALTSPVVGAIADRGGRRKPWLAVFTATGVAFSAALWFVRPDPSSIPLALVCAAVATVAVEVGGVFYNAMLPELTDESRYGRLSGWGWGIGYAGGLTCLVVSLTVFVQADPPPFGLDKASAEHVRATALLVAAWFGLFSLPMFLLSPDRAAVKGSRASRAVREGLATLWATLRGLPGHRAILWFLVARMFYTDGLNTMFAFGGIYAAGTFGMTLAEVIQFGIAMNVTAGLGAVAFGWLDDRIGPKPTIIVSLIGLIAFGASALLVESKTVFWWIGVAFGLFVGPAQAASRSLMAHLAPEEVRTEMFGLLALSGKVTAFLGPMVLAWTTAAFDSQRAGMATVIVFLAAGLLILLPVGMPHRRRPAQGPVLAPPPS